MKQSSIVGLLLVASWLIVNLTGQPFVRVDNLSTSVVAPQIVTVTGTAQYVFTASDVRTQGRVFVRTIQNTGTSPVLYAIGSVASASSYHGVIAAGSTARDGLGSVVDLSRFPGRVPVVTESGTSTICLVELQQ